VSCLETKKAVIIDPVLDYNPNNANTSTESIDGILDYLNQKGLSLHCILETHAHADHITSAAYIVQRLKVKVAIGIQIQSVQKTFKEIFNLDDSFKTDGSQFNQLLKDGDEIQVGELGIKVIHTPGHTNDSMCFVCGDCVFIGDTLFSPDYGSARCDFPGGDAGKLFDSVQKLYALGENKKLYLCHDYPPITRKEQSWFLSSVQQSENIHLNQSIKKEDFVQMREQRDAQLNQPKLIIPSIQINIRAGNLPKSESNGKIYLKTPLNVIGKAH